jgi:hypothetical protein
MTTNQKKNNKIINMSLSFFIFRMQRLGLVCWEHFNQERLWKKLAISFALLGGPTGCITTSLLITTSMEDRPKNLSDWITVCEGGMFGGFIGFVGGAILGSTLPVTLPPILISSIIYFGIKKDPIKKN